MSRMLSELLGAPEPMFHQNLHRLEQASGLPSNDIRLSSEMMRGVQSKLRELGLDPHDTTGPELFAALESRLQADDERLVHALKALSKQSDIIESVAHALRTVPLSRSCFALKAVVAKKLLKKIPPKKTMKQLGYRSLESMLKHEPVPLLYSAAWLTESVSWRRSLIDLYKSLQATDFEVRDIAILSPSSARWQKLAAIVVAEKRHNVISFKELGAIVLLPFSTEIPRAAATTTLLIALYAWNDIRTTSTFLKLCQVKPEFGKIVQSVALNEPQLSAEMFDRPVPWQIIQRYYARFKTAFRSEIFEPHILAEDLNWHSIEKVLGHIEPSLEFWRGTTHLSLLHDHQPVSFNILDVCLTYCNHLPFEQRVVQYFRSSLWNELLLRYLKPEKVEETVTSQLQSELATEPALS